MMADSARAQGEAAAEAHRVRVSPAAVAESACWHCGAKVGDERVARYLYRGELPKTAIVEDWYACRCGAFQNVRTPTEISVTSLHDA